MRKAISATLAIFLTFFVCTFLTHASRGIKITAIEDLNHRSGKLGEFKALVIGINDYADPKIPDLQTAVKDAGTMAGILAEKYGFKVETLFDNRATRGAIYQKLRSLAASSRPDDSVLIYFAGHGDLDRVYDDGWWIPADAAAGKPVTYFSNLEVQKAMRSMKARHVLLISDSCYSGTLFGESRALSPVIDDKYYLRLYKEKSRWGMTSGNKEPVSDAGSEGHSVFAYQLLKELKRNAKPFVSIQEIYTRIAPIISNNSEQTPLCRPIRKAGDQGGEFVFVAAVKDDSAPAVTKPKKGSLELDLAFWQSIKNSDDPALFQAYLQQFPNGTFVPIAKRKLEMFKSKKEVASISPEDTKPEPAPEILKAKLFVETVPEGARVRILNIKPKFRQGIELYPGSYHIEVAARGYEIEKKWIKLVADEEKRISINLSKKNITQPKSEGKVFRRWLGVTIQDLTVEMAEYYGFKDQKGVLVVEAFKGEPAEKAGIKPKDIILEVNDKKIETSRQLTGTIAGLKAGDAAKVRLFRNGKIKTFHIKLDDYKKKSSLAPQKDKIIAYSNKIGTSPKKEVIGVISSVNQEWNFIEISLKSSDIKPGDKVFTYHRGNRYELVIKKIYKLKAAALSDTKLSTLSSGMKIYKY